MSGREDFDFSDARREVVRLERINAEWRTRVEAAEWERDKAWNDRDRWHTWHDEVYARAERLAAALRGTSDILARVWRGEPHPQGRGPTVDNAEFWQALKQAAEATRAALAEEEAKEAAA